MQKHYDKWKVFSPLGLLLIGFGLSVVGDATASKINGKSWVAKGTIGLILFNAGMSIFGEAIKSRTLYESEAE